MIISGLLNIFGVGCLGGIIGEIAHWYELRTSPRFPDYARHWLYWLATVAMIIVGGLLAAAYGPEPKSVFLVGNIGLSAPLIIKTLAENTPPPPPPAADFVPGRPASLWRFLGGRGSGA